MYAGHWVDYQADRGGGGGSTDFENVTADICSRKGDVYTRG